MLAQMHKVVCVVDSGRTFGLNLTGREAVIVHFPATHGHEKDWNFDSRSSCIIIISTVVLVKVEEGGVYSPPWIFIDVCQKT
jgi:hypothetical protein